MPTECSDPRGAPTATAGTSFCPFADSRTRPVCSACQANRTSLFGFIAPRSSGPFGRTTCTWRNAMRHASTKDSSAPIRLSRRPAARGTLATPLVRPASRRPSAPKRKSSRVDRCGLKPCWKRKTEAFGGSWQQGDKADGASQPRGPRVMTTQAEFSFVGPGSTSFAPPNPCSSGVEDAGAQMGSAAPF